MSDRLSDAVLSLMPIADGETVIVEDPDFLARSPAVLDALHEREVAAVIWHDPLESRLAWVDMEPIGTVALLVGDSSGGHSLPSDIAACADRTIRVEQRSLFANLASAVVRDLDWADRTEALDIDRVLKRPIRDSESRSQLLRRIYELDIDAMEKPARLLEGLLRLHRVARPTPISEGLARFFAERVSDPLPGMATERAVRDRDAFLGWLQRAWNRIASDPSLRELLLAVGPRQLLDDYFEEGLLHPIDSISGLSLPFGVRSDANSEHAARVASAAQGIQVRLTNAELGYDDWRWIAGELGTAIAVMYEGGGVGADTLAPLRLKVNERFVPWLVEHYADLTSLPAVDSPPMVHRASRTMELQRRDRRIALVVVDGLSISVWRTLLPIIRSDRWDVAETTTFAWLPTITSVSRQAIFAGRPPTSFAGTIGTTSTEPMLWRDWWAESAKLPSHEVGYARLHLRNDAVSDLRAAPALSNAVGASVLAVVVEDVDHEMHGERLGEETFHAAMRAWGTQRHLGRLIDLLLAEGYRVYLTSDHGYTEVETLGVSQAGVNADKHGRFEVYADSLLLDNATASNKLPDRLRWAGHGLPKDYLVYFAPLLGALKPKGDRLLSHGGPTIEEVIVPWVVIDG